MKLKGWMIGGIVGGLITIILFVIWRSLLFCLPGESCKYFKSYYYLILLLYFFMIIIFAIINDFIITRTKKIKLFMSIIDGIWISIILSIILTIIIIGFETSICTGTYCGELGMAIPALLIITFLVLLIPNIIIGSIVGLKND